MKANKNNILSLLKTSKGHIEGIINMVEDDRYCIEISNQLLAVMAILKKANTDILTAHLSSCLSNGENMDEKIKELNNVLSKILK